MATPVEYTYAKTGDQIELVPKGYIPQGSTEVSQQDFQNFINTSTSGPGGLSSWEEYYSSNTTPGLYDAYKTAMSGGTATFGQVNDQGQLERTSEMQAEQQVAQQVASGQLVPDKNLPGAYVPKGSAAQLTQQGMSMNQQLQQPTVQAQIKSQNLVPRAPEDYKAAFEATKGKNAAATVGGGMKGVNDALGGVPQTGGPSIADTLFQSDPYFQGLQQMAQQFFSTENQRMSLTQEYQKMLKDSGIEALDTQLLNMKNVIEGTEDDIRNEVLKAGGFATDSQVQALTLARNKQLIKNYNNLLETRNNKEQYLNQMMTLSQQDRQLASQNFDRMMNIGFQMADYGMKMQQNAISGLDKIVSQVGYDGLLQMSQGDPASISRVERLLGMNPGGLTQLAELSMQQRQRAQMKEDLQMQVLQSQLETDKYQRAKILKEIQDSGLSGVDPSQILAYANQYASTGTIPTGIPKGTFGLIASTAKEMPKAKGTLVDKNTGIKSSGTNDTLQGAYGTLYSVVDLAKQLKELDANRKSGIVAGTLGKLFGSEAQTKYMDLRGQIIDLLARARSGAALTVQEEERYGNMLPGRFAEPLGIGIDPSVKLNNFINNISTDLQNKLDTQGLSIYGFSKVDIGGKQYTVGDIVQNSNGQQGRVNPDGSITLLQ